MEIVITSIVCNIVQLKDINWAFKNNPFKFYFPITASGEHLSLMILSSIYSDCL